MLTDTPTIRRALVVVIGLVALAGCDRDGGDTTSTTTSSSTTAPSTTTTSTTPASTTERLIELGGTPCPDSDFTCLSIEVPWDHNLTDEGRTLEVDFAVLPARDRREGVFVVAVGGPGSSGIEESQWAQEWIPDEILSVFDVVFFDHRGLSKFANGRCSVAETRLQRELSDDWLENWEALLNAYVPYIPACHVEALHGDIAGYVGTDHAVGDLEAFRRLMGYDRLTVLGQSYGTLFAQAYASRYPASVDRVVLDGTIDYSADRLGFVVDRAEGLDLIIDRMFARCDSDEWCADDMGGPAAEVYERLVSDLSAGGVEVRYPTEPDVWETFTMTAYDLSEYAFDAAYDEEWRMLFMRGLASYARDDSLVLMTRLNWLSRFTGGDTDADIFWAVVCADSPIPGADRVSELDALHTAYLEMAGSRKWIILQTLGCLDWPHRDRAVEPTPWVGTGIPTMLVATLDDPTTPYAQTRAVFDRLVDGYLITVDGGSHVAFGLGHDCVDGTVTNFVLGIDPARERTCRIGAPYYPPLIDFSHSMEWALWTLEDEVWYLPELAVWDWVGELVIGCDLGGRITVVAESEDLVTFALSDCAMAPGLVISATGSWDWTRERTHIEYVEAGCTHTFTRPWSGNVRYTDSCD